MPLRMNKLSRMSPTIYLYAQIVLFSQLVGVGLKWHQPFWMGGFPTIIMLFILRVWWPVTNSKFYSAFLLHNLHCFNSRSSSRKVFKWCPIYYEYSTCNTFIDGGKEIGVFIVLYLFEYLFMTKDKRKLVINRMKRPE